MPVHDAGWSRRSNATIAIALLACVSCPALASAQPAEPGGLVVQAGLGNYALNNTQLGKIRGGMTLPDGLNLSFGFRQVTTVNGTLVLSVLVPQISITEKTMSIPVYVYSAVTTPQISSNAATVPGVSGNTGSPTPVTNTGSTTQTSFNQSTTQTTIPVTTPTPQTSTTTTQTTPATPVSAPPVTTITTTTTSGSLTDKPAGTVVNVPVSTRSATGTAPGGITYTVPASGPTTTILATNGGDAGATSVSTTFSGGGILNGISNSMSNQIIQQSTLMNISVTGLNESMIASQTANRVLSNVTRGFAGTP